MDDFLRLSICCSMAVSRLAIFWFTGTPMGFPADHRRHDLEEEGLHSWQAALLPLSLICHLVSHLLCECLQVDPGRVKLCLSIFSQG